MFDEKKVEFISEKVHDSWWEEKKRQGFHTPVACGFANEGNKALVAAIGKDPRFHKYCDKCHTDMYPYAELPENVKEYDRVTVRAVLAAEEIYPNPVIDLWYIECRTGCSCCSDQNFNIGFYKTIEEAGVVVEKYRRGEGNPLASQYAKYGRYEVHSCKAEILPDGRMIISDEVFSKDYFGDFNW